MEIHVFRSAYKAEGWAPLPVLVLGTVPRRAYEFARARNGGSVAPTDDEIADAVRLDHTRCSGPGALRHGDICVDRVIVQR